ncbi:MAG: class I SAM-dependent DNA methyltransferase [Treponema sp.]|jgi:type I restriction-modification system DNA methylase subunit|nr:class I SAM-dependent DNA methyltransferase [Treponema sp.]
MLTQAQQRKAAKEFAKKWENIGYEKGDSARFWLSLLNEVFGVEKSGDFIRFEDKVVLDNTSFIDGYIPSTHVLIEQKSIDKDLRKPFKQSDGSLLSPFQQAKRYSIELPYSDRPRWIVLSNFKEFHIFDMEKPRGEPEVVYLKDLEDDYYRLQFLVDEEDHYIKKATEVSIQAGELVGMLYDALLEQYKNPNDEETLKNLNVLCVRLVFCFYAEDAGLFGRRNMFHDYMAKHKQSNDGFREALSKLFMILDQDEHERDPYLSEDLLAFPYVNGGLFEKKELIIPRFNEKIIDIILEKASASFDWSNISPTIFGGVFESTLNPETRRSGGMHYTSIENIHKVIDPLFMNELREEFKEIQMLKTVVRKKERLEELQNKMASLKFLDPAAGSGNFLTETYISLRKLENDILKELYDSQIMMGELHNPIKVSINQFYGIEINDFAVSVARTALWIAESQMMKKTENIVNIDLDFLPLKTYPNIVEDNALRMNWEDVVQKHELNYIMGNPPFVGYSLQDAEQKEDIKNVFRDKNGKPYKNAGKIDYVAGWYYKACQYMQGTNIKAALVSTNSITQGEQVAFIWQLLLELFDVRIHFAYQSFVWDSEASDKAQVHVVVIGFSSGFEQDIKYLFDSGSVKKVERINPYLIEAPDVLIESRRKSICDVPAMIYGNKPTDGGFLFLTPDEREQFLLKEPKVKKFIKQIYGAEEFINNKKRYCLWLVDATPSELRSMPLVLERVSQVRDFRLKSTKEATRKSAETPALFQEIRQPKKDYIIIPRVSSENRKYIPIGFVSSEIIVNDAVQIIPDADLYHFGILTSNVHMAWMRVVAGRLKSDYRYSANIVYNNFPWASPSESQKAKIETTAQNILDARALYPDSSLADLYDELTMPPELRKAHQENDKAVMDAYGFEWRNMTESECVASLFKIYASSALSLHQK